MPLHADNNNIAMPVAFNHLPEHSNFTWLLTDYNEENGATAIVPGSHKLCRAPTAHEARDISLRILRLFAGLIPIIMFCTNIATLLILTLGGRFVMKNTSHPAARVKL